MAPEKSQQLVKKELGESWKSSNYAPQTYFACLLDIGLNSEDAADFYMSNNRETPALFKLYHMKGDNISSKPQMPTDIRSVTEFMYKCLPNETRVRYLLTGGKDAPPVSGIPPKLTVTVSGSWTVFYKLLVQIREAQYDLVHMHYFQQIMNSFSTATKLAADLIVSPRGVPDPRLVIVALLASLPRSIRQHILSKLVSRYPEVVKQNLDARQDIEKCTETLTRDAHAITSLIYSEFTIALNDLSIRISAVSRRSRVQGLDMCTLDMKRYVIDTMSHQPSALKALRAFIYNAPFRPIYCAETREFLQECLREYQVLLPSNSPDALYSLLAFLKHYMPALLWAWVEKTDDVTGSFSKATSFDQQHLLLRRIILRLLEFYRFYVSPVTVDEAWRSVTTRLVADDNTEDNTEERNLGNWLKTIRLYYMTIREPFHAGFDWVWPDMSVYPVHDPSTLFYTLWTATGTSKLITPKERVLVIMAFFPEYSYNELIFSDEKYRMVGKWLNVDEPGPDVTEDVTPSAMELLKQLCRNHLPQILASDFDTAWNHVKYQAYYENHGGRGFEAYYKSYIQPRSYLREKSLLQRYNASRNASFTKREAKPAAVKPVVSSKTKVHSHVDEESGDSESEVDEGDYMLNFINPETGQLTKRMKNLEINIYEEIDPLTDAMDLFRKHDLRPPLSVPRTSIKCFFCLNNHSMAKCVYLDMLYSIKAVLGYTAETVTIERAPGTNNSRSTITLRKLSTVQDSCIFWSTYFQGHLIRYIMRLKPYSTKEYIVLDDVISMNRFDLREIAY